MKLVADNIRITKKEIQQALEQKDPKPLQRLASACAAAGAHMIDINTGPLKRDPGTAMAFFVTSVEAVTDLPLLIDTTNPVAMAAGLATAKNPVILNGVSLEPAKLSRILPLAVSHDADVVGYLIHPDSRVPKGSAGRLSLALALVEAAEQAGLSRERLILDPVVPPLSWDDGLFRARETVETVRMLPELLGYPVRTIAGLSNLTSGARNIPKKTRMEETYLTLLAGAGLSFLMLDILNPETMAAARAADLLIKETIFSWAQVP